MLTLIIKLLNSSNIKSEYCVQLFNIFIFLTINQMKSNDYSKISKVGQQTKRQINFVDKLLEDAHANSKSGGIRSANPNPILGTEREKELKINQLLGVENEIQQLAIQANNHGLPAGFTAILNQDMIQQLNEQSMDQLNRAQNAASLAHNQRGSQGNRVSGHISTVTAHHVTSPASGDKVTQKQNGFLKSGQHMQSGYQNINTKGVGSPLDQQANLATNQDKTLSNQYLFVTPGQNNDLAGKDMAPFISNQQTNVASKQMSGLKSDRNIGKRSLQEMSTARDVHRPAEPMSGTLNTKVQLQMTGTQYVAENRNSNRGPFGAFSKIRTNSLEEPDSKSSNDVTSDHLPGILPHNQVYGVDSKGILGFTLQSPSHTPITQNIYSKYSSKDPQVYEQNTLQGLFGAQMGSRDHMAAGKGPNKEVDQLLNQVRQRKKPKQSLNNILFEKNQLSHLNPIKVTKIYSKQQNNDAAKNVYNKLFNDIQPKESHKDSGSSPTFPNDEIKDGLNKFNSLQKMTANIDGPQQFSNLMPKASNSQIRVFGDQYNTIQQNAQMNQYIPGAYVMGIDPLQLDSNRNSVEGDMVRGTSKKIYRRKEYSQIYERNLEDQTPHFENIGGTQTGPEPKSIQPIIRRNHHTREGTTNELPKIKRVSIAPRLEFDNQMGEKRNGIASQVNQRERKISPRWRTPINNDNFPGSTQFSFNLSNDFPTGRRVLQEDKMNRTQDFVVFKQGFSASKFPNHYKANEINNSMNMSSRRNSPRQVGITNSAQFKLTLDSKRNSLNNGQTTVSIGQGSRNKLLEQMKNMKNNQNYQSGKNEKSSYGATQTDEHTTPTAAATDRAVTFAQKIQQSTAVQPHNTQDAMTNSEIAHSEFGTVPTNRTTNTNQRHRLVKELQDMIGESNHKENPNGDLIELNESAQNQAQEEASHSLEYLQQARNENLSTIDTKLQHQSVSNNPSLNIPMQPQLDHIQAKRNSNVLIANLKNQNLNRIQMSDQIMSAEEMVPSLLQPSHLTSPKQMGLSDTNFYRDIESLPNIPVLIDLKVQDQLRALQKKIRLSKEKIKEKFIQNEIQREKIQENLNQRDQLIKTLNLYVKQVDPKNALSEHESEQEGMKNEALTPSTPIGFTTQTQRQRTPDQASQAFDQSHKSNIEDEIASEIDRTTQLHNNSTTIANQINSFQGNIAQVAGKTSGGLPSQPLQSLGNINDNSLNLSQDQLQKEIQSSQNADGVLRDSLNFKGTPETTIHTGVAGSTETPIKAMHLLSGQQNMDYPAPISHTPKFDQSRSLNKLYIQKQIEKKNKNLEIERQILSLYKYKFTNDFNREKAQLDNQTGLLKGQVDQEQEEIKRLREENAQMLKSIRRYAQYVDNFKQEKGKFTTYLQNQQEKKVMSKISNNLQKQMRKHRTQVIQEINVEKCDSPLEVAKEFTLAIEEKSPHPPKIKTNTNSPMTPIKHLQESNKESNLDKVDKEIADEDLKQRSRNIQENFTTVSKSLAHNVVNPTEQGILMNKSKLNVDKSIEAESSLNTIPTAMMSAVYEKIDMNKVVKFGYQVQQQCQVSDKPLDFALRLLEIVKQFTGCAKAMIIPIDYYLGTLMTSRQYNSREKMLNVHSIEFTDSTNGEQQRLAVVAMAEDEMSKSLAFESITNPNGPSLVTKDNKLAIIFRQEKQNGGPSFILQVEAVDNLQDQQGQRGSKASKKTTLGKSGKKTSTRFSAARSDAGSKDGFMKRAGIEGLIMQVVFRSVQLKFECLQQNLQIKNFGSQKDNTLKMISDCTKSATLRGLMRTMYKVYKAYTGFEEMNIMFHDKDKNQLYAITFGDDEEHYQNVQNAIKRATSEKEKQSILVKESVRDVILSQNQMIYYPIHMGITSQVFKTQKLYMMNNFKASSNFDFMNEIDNPKGLKKINNLMIGPLIREDGSSNGIIQLYNSKNPISSHEKKKFAAVTKFFGGMIENVENKTIKLTTMVAVELAKDGPNDALERAFDAIVGDGTINSFLNVKKPLDIIDADLDRNFNITHPEWAHLEIPTEGEVNIFGPKF